MKIIDFNFGKEDNCGWGHLDIKEEDFKFYYDFVEDFVKTFEEGRHKNILVEKLNNIIPKIKEKNLLNVDIFSQWAGFLFSEGGFSTITINAKVSQGIHNNLSSEIRKDIRKNYQDFGRDFMSRNKNSSGQFQDRFRHILKKHYDKLELYKLIGVDYIEFKEGKETYSLHSLMYILCCGAMINAYKIINSNIREKRIDDLEQKKFKEISELTLKFAIIFELFVINDSTINKNIICNLKKVYKEKKQVLVQNEKKYQTSMSGLAEKHNLKFSEIEYNKDDFEVLMDTITIKQMKNPSREFVELLCSIDYFYIDHSQIKYM